jgi:2-dehydro-3-deoxy-D-pentonate aldolase
VVSVPYYFTPTQAELGDYVRRLASELPLPLVLYSIPSLTRVGFAPDTVRRALQLEKVIGIKDSTGDLDYFDQLLSIAKERPDWTVLVGQEALLAETVRRGGFGGVNAGANLHPRLFVSLYEAAVAGDKTEVAALQEKVLTVGRIYDSARTTPSVIKGIKCALSMLGVCRDILAEPLSSLPASEHERIRGILSELEPIS